jgi:hypothetical protein
MRADHFSDLITNLDDGIQDAGILIDQGNLRTADFSKLFFIQQQKITAAESDRTASQPGCRREKLQEGKSQCGLARARLSQKADNLAGRNVETYSVENGEFLAIVHKEAHPQIADLKEILRILRTRALSFAGRIGAYNFHRRSVLSSVQSSELFPDPDDTRATNSDHSRSSQIE